MKRLFLLIMFCCLFFSSAQIEKDTTFTIQAELKKQIKKYPNIKIANVFLQNGIKAEYNINYKKLSNRNLSIDAFINAASTKLPAIVIFHGGGWKSGNKEMQNPMAQKLANLGFQTFTVEYRLSDEAKYPAAILDGIDAIRFIKENSKKFNINKKKIVILGCSSGAQMATLIGEQYPNEIAAIINIDGVLAFHHPESSEGNSAAFWLGGTYNEVPKIWEEASPLSHVSKKSPPILFINSQFPRFHAGRDDMITKLNAFKIYSEINNIEDSPHSFWLFDPWFQPTIDYIHNFLNLTLKNN